MQLLKIMLSCAFMVLTACSGSTTSTSNPVPGDISLDEGGVSALEEGQTYELTASGGTAAGTTVSSWSWSEDPIVAGALSQCSSVVGFDVDLAATRLEAACTIPDRCVVAFDQISSVDATGAGDTKFAVAVPVLRAPVGLTYRLEAIDERGQRNSTNYTFCLISKNEPPVAEDDVFTILEGRVTTITGDSSSHLLSNDYDDIDVGNRVLAVLSDPVRPPQFDAQFSLGADGGFTYFYAGDPNVAGGMTIEDSFEYQITDGSGVSSATVILRIRTEDNPPVFDSSLSGISVIAGVDQEIDLSIYFTDPEGSELSYAVDPSSLPGSGGLTVNPLGVLTGQAAAGDVATYSLLVTASDQTSSERGQIPLIVNGNEPPIATPIPTLTIAFGDLVSMDVARYFTDPEGADLTFGLQSQPASGLTINPATGLITGQITSAGTYTLTVTANDGTSAGVSSTFTIVQQQIPNRAPQLIEEVAQQSITIGQPINAVTPEIIDPDGDPLTYAINAVPAGLVFSTATGTLSGTPSTVGISSVVITASDPAGLSASTNVFTIAATRVPNAAPEFSGTIATVSGNVSVPIAPVSGLFSDPEGEALVYSTGVLPTGLTLDTSSGVITGTPSTVGASLVTISATDPDGESVSSNQFSVVIAAAPNNAPAFGGRVGDQSVTVGTPIVPVTGTFTDPDTTDSLTYTILPAAGSGLLFSTSTGTLSGSPNAIGTQQFVITATDPGGLSASSNSFSIAATAVPNIPPASGSTIGNQTVTIGSALTPISSNFTDPDAQSGDSLSYGITPSVSGTGLSFSSTSGTLSGTPNALGTTVFTITATDVDGGSGSSNPFTLTVTSIPNNAPEFVGGIANQSVILGSAISAIIPVFTDADAGDSLSYSISPAVTGSGLAFNATTGRVTGTPNALGSTTYQIRATDESSEFADSDPFTITVNDVPNTAPVFGAIIDDQTVVEGDPIVLITPDVQDPDAGDVLVYSIAPTTTGSGLLFSTVTGELSGTPIATDTYIITATDDAGASASSDPFTITVNVVLNNPPVFGATIDNQTVVEGDPIVLITPDVQDPDPGDVLVYSIAPVTTGTGLLFSTVTGELSGTPAATESYIITATDDGGLSASSNSFTLTVSPLTVNSPPILVTGISDQSLILDDPVLPPISAVFSDADAGDVLTYSVTPAVLPGGLEFSIATGEISGTPLALSPALSVVITASDGTDTASATFSLEIVPGDAA